MRDRVETLWTSDLLSSAEHFVLARAADGWSLSGTTVVPFEDRPAHIAYRVLADSWWRTQSAEVSVNVDGSERGLRLEADQGRWRIDGAPRADLDGCVDVDLGWTPATNTLPIRRLDLEVDVPVELSVAWLRFPELTVERSTQTYTRLGATTWRYQSGPYDFILEATPEGVVTRYGEERIWVAAAGG
jgi:hypothetical protein